MTEDNPPSNPTAPSDAVEPKKETVRITLPPRPSEIHEVKRETIRIEVPQRPQPMRPMGTPSPSAPSSEPVSPKPAFTSGQAPAKPPLPAVKPLGAVGSPRPPILGATPGSAFKPATAPPRPTASSVSSPRPPAPAQAENKSATTKDETARVAESKPVLPKATTKFSQPPAASSIAAPALRTTEMVEVTDPLITPLSIATFVISLVALVINYLAYSA